MTLSRNREVFLGQQNLRGHRNSYKDLNQPETLTQIKQISIILLEIMSLPRNFKKLNKH